MKKQFLLFLLLFLFLVTGCDKNDFYNKPDKLKKVDVTFDYDNTSFENQTITMMENDKILNPSVDLNPNLYGYEFLGWYIGDDKWNFEEDVVTIDLTLKAKWGPLKYKIIINFNNPNYENVTLVHEAGEIVDYKLEDNLIKDGYKFVGWDKKIPFFMPEEDININAIYEELTSRIIFETDTGLSYVYTGIVGSEIKYDTGLGEFLKNDFNKKGYKFVGWDKEIPTYMPKDDMALNAIYLCDVNYTIKGDSIYFSGNNTENVTILDKYDGISVKGINNCAFLNSSTLESIVLPSSCTTIGDCAFYGCSNLKSVKFNNSTLAKITIYQKAFYNCNSLESLVLNSPDLWEYAFYGCSSLKEVTINKCPSYIPPYCFAECSSLEKLYYDAAPLKPIREYAFHNCTSLTEITLNIANMGSSSCQKAFINCPNLININLLDWKTDYAHIVRCLQDPNDFYFGWMENIRKKTIYVSYSDYRKITVVYKADGAYFIDYGEIV